MVEGDSESCRVHPVETWVRMREVIQRIRSCDAGTGFHRYGISGYSLLALPIKTL